MFKKFIEAAMDLEAAERNWGAAADELVHQLCTAVEKGFAVWVEASREEDPEGGWIVTTESACAAGRRIQVDERRYGPRWRVTYCYTLEEAAVEVVIAVPVNGMLGIDYPDLSVALAMIK